MAYLDNVTNILQIQPDGLPTVVRLSQNENGRRLYFRLVGNEDPIPSGVTVTISGTKPDGAVYSASGTITNDVVLINENTQMTAVAGTWDAKIKIVSSGQTIATGRVRFEIDADTVAPGSVPSDSELEGLVAEAQAYAENARSAAYGSPLTASTVAGMTDQTRVYVYTGSETGYTAGNWYYWNGTAWTSGGVYNSTAIQTDMTLAIPGMAADAKATGDAIDGLDTRLDTAEDDITDVKSDLAQIVPGLSDDAKVALLACFEHVAWSDGSGQEYYDALEDALYDTYPKITALYSPGSHIVYDDDTLDSLKPYLVVTYYETSEDEGTVISASSYTLSGILVAGTSTITVTYNTLQTNFKVTALDHDFYWSYPDDRLTVLEAGLTRDDNYAYHAMFVDYTKQYTKATFGTSSQYGYAPFKLLTDHQTDTALCPVPLPNGATKCHVKYTPDPGATTPTCQTILYYFESPTWRTRSYLPATPTSDTEFDVDFSSVIAEDIAGGHEYIYALSIGASDSNDTRKQKYLSLSLVFS